MRILELINWIKNRVPYTYYPNRFPATSPDRCAYVVIHPGEPVDEWTGKKVVNFQVVVRDEKYGYPEAEEKANQVFNAIVNQRDITIGSDYITQITAVGSAPFYIGDDENDRPVYSMNFRAVIKPKITRN